MNDAVKKILAALVLAAAVVYLGNTYLLEPKRQTIKKVKTEREKMEKEIARLKAAQKRVAVIEKEIAQLQLQLDQLKGILPSRKEIPQLLRQVPKLGYYNGIVFNIFKPGRQTVGEIYGTLPVSLSFSCTYPQLVSLMRGITSLERLIKPTSLKVTSKSTMGINPRLAVSCTLATYWYTGEE